MSLFYFIAAIITGIGVSQCINTGEDTKAIILIIMCVGCMLCLEIRGLRK